MFGFKKRGNYRRFDARVSQMLNGPVVTYVSWERSERGVTTADLTDMVELGVKAGESELGRKLNCAEHERVEHIAMHLIAEGRRIM